MKLQVTKTIDVNSADDVFKAQVEYPGHEDPLFNWAKQHITSPTFFLRWAGISPKHKEECYNIIFVDKEADRVFYSLLWAKVNDTHKKECLERILRSCNKPVIEDWIASVGEGVEECRKRLMAIETMGLL